MSKGWCDIAATVDLPTAQRIAEQIVKRFARLGPKGSQALQEIVGAAEVEIAIQRRQPPEHYRAHNAARR